jgi:hypothetical protein
MAWDSSRRVPWRRVIKLYAIYALVANIALAFMYRGRYGVGSAIGTLIAGVFYALLLAVMFKLGLDPFRAYRRSPRADPDGRPVTRASRRNEPDRADAPRPKPAPTRRTSTGPNHPRPKRR